MTTTQEAQEHQWNNREEEDIAPDILKFRPASIPGPKFDTTGSWTPIGLFQLFFYSSVIRTIVDNTNLNAAKRLQAGMAFKWITLRVKVFYVFLAII